ncbi:unnamed protein product, partial [Meganyctiphanes norvegica]
MSEMFFEKGLKFGNNICARTLSELSVHLPAGKELIEDSSKSSMFQTHFLLSKFSIGNLFNQVFIVSKLLIELQNVLKLRKKMCSIFRNYVVPVHKRRNHISGLKYASRRTETLYRRVIKESELIDATSLNNMRILAFASTLQWASSYCSDVPYILKMYDDSLLNVFSLSQYLETLLRNTEDADTSERNIKTKIRTQTPKDGIVDRPGCMSQLPSCILCVKLSSGVFSKVQRAGKWKVSRREYPSNSYPSYCHGLGYLLQPAAAHRLLQHIPDTTYFKIEDVFVTGILRESAGLSVHRMNNNFTRWTAFITTQLFVQYFVEGVKPILELDSEVSESIGAAAWRTLLTRNNLTHLINQTAQLRSGKSDRYILC